MGHLQESCPCFHAPIQPFSLKKETRWWKKKPKNDLWDESSPSASDQPPSALEKPPPS